MRIFLSFQVRKVFASTRNLTDWNRSGREGVGGKIIQRIVRYSALLMKAILAARGAHSYKNGRACVAVPYMVPALDSVARASRSVARSRSTASAVPPWFAAYFMHHGFPSHGLSSTAVLQRGSYISSDGDGGTRRAQSVAEHSQSGFVSEVRVRVTAK